MGERSLGTRRAAGRRPKPAVEPRLKGINGRGERIRTSGLLVPNQEPTQYQSLTGIAKYCPPLRQVASFQRLPRNLPRGDSNSEQRFYAGGRHKNGHSFLAPCANGILGSAANMEPTKPTKLYPCFSHIRNLLIRKRGLNARSRWLLITGGALAQIDHTLGTLHSRQDHCPRDRPEQSEPLCVRIGFQRPIERLMLEIIWGCPLG